MRTLSVESLFGGDFSCAGSDTSEFFDSVVSAVVIMEGLQITLILQKIQND